MYSPRRYDAWYTFVSWGGRIVEVSENNKFWKDIICELYSPRGFGCRLSWRVVVKATDNLIRLSDEDKAKRDDIKLYKIDARIATDHNHFERYWSDSLIEDFPVQETLSGGDTRIVIQGERVIKLVVSENPEIDTTVALPGNMNKTIIAPIAIPVGPRYVAINRGTRFARPNLLEEFRVFEAFPYWSCEPFFYIYFMLSVYNALLTEIT